LALGEARSGGGNDEGYLRIRGGELFLTAFISGLDSVLSRWIDGLDEIV
jgi:hypothetical protein